MPVEVLLNNLERVQKTGHGRWLACCPAHDDKNRSLSVGEKDDGRVLVHCFAGCSVHAILDATSLTFQDLMPDPVQPGQASVCRANALDALQAVDVSALTIYLIASDFERTGALSPSNKESLKKAREAIGDAYDLVVGRGWQQKVRL